MIVNVVLWVAGIALIAVGYTRAKGPWSRYQALKEQEANATRYNAWRGGIRDDSASGADLAMAILRKRAQYSAAVAVAGFVLVFLGFLIK